MITYILQTIAFQLVFLLLYELLLKKETFFQWNRLYLCLTPLLSLVLPFIKIPAFQKAMPPEFTAALPEVLFTNAATENSAITAGQSLSVLQLVLISGIVVSALLFLWKLIKIRRLVQNAEKEMGKKHILIWLPDSTAAFSFAGIIFLGKNLKQDIVAYIIEHELVHLRQKHYLDLIYFEVLRIFFWFNPLIYLYQKRLSDLHEYIADAEVVSQTAKKSYYQDLLSVVFQTNTISFVNTFFNHSLIKNRIVMLNKSKSKKARLLKFTLLLPLLAVFLFITSCETSLTDASEEVQLKTTVESGETSAVPFAVIDRVPIYPGCEDFATNEELRKCFSERITQLVIENFDTTVAKGSGLTGRQRIQVQFQIDDTGNVIAVKANGPSAALMEEAKRVINLTPQLQPGYQNGKAVHVVYALPIVFEVKN